jgi:hypothetical protein
MSEIPGNILPPPEIPGNILPPPCPRAAESRSAPTAPALPRRRPCLADFEQVAVNCQPEGRGRRRGPPADDRRRHGRQCGGLSESRFKASAAVVHRLADRQNIECEKVHSRVCRPEAQFQVQVELEIWCYQQRPGPPAGRGSPVSQLHENGSSP